MEGMFADTSSRAAVLVTERTHVVLTLHLPDRPGALGAVASRIGAVGADITDVRVASRREGIAEDVTRFHTRGCPFINASAEFPDPDSEVRRVVRRHRDWFRATLADVVRAAGIADPEDKAAALVLLRDAALVGAYLDPDDDPVEAFRRTSRQVVHDHGLVAGGADPDGADPRP